MNPNGDDAHDDDEVMQAFLNEGQNAWDDLQAVIRKEEEDEEEEEARFRILVASLRQRHHQLQEI